MEKLSEEQKKCILYYAKNNMRLYATAKELYYHRNTVQRHFEEIKKKTGLEPRRFYDLRKLLDGLDHQ